MGKIYDKAQKKKIKEFYDEYLTSLPELLSQIEKLDKDDKGAKEKVMALLQDRLDLIKKEIDKNKGQSIGEAWDFSKEKKEPLLISDDIILLEPMSEKYYDLYLKTREVYSNSNYTDPVYKEVFIKEVTNEKSLFVAIIRKSDNAYLGYVGLKDTSVNLWEFCVELLPEYCNQGYGYKAVKLFIKKISEITKNDKQQFMALVEVDNIASQKLMLKLGGRLIDIYDYTFHDEEQATEFEEEHLDEITDHMIELAEELMVEPRKLLSHVLDYRIFAEKL